MKTVFSYENNFYPCSFQFIPVAGDNIFLDYDLAGERFFLVKMRTFDITDNQIILSIVKI